MSHQRNMTSSVTIENEFEIVNKKSVDSVSQNIATAYLRVMIVARCTLEVALGHMTK
jgi:hypothetical protein